MAGIRVHGESYHETRLHHIWVNMRYRCNNPNCSHYNRYGGRGIKVCDEWNEYLPFKKWAMANGYDDSKSIDRIDNNGNYDPNNCRWATMKTQSNNRSSNNNITYNCETHTVTEWASIVGINENTLRSRLFVNKWDIETALTTPVNIKGKRYLFHNGEEHTVTEWSNILNIPREILFARLSNLHWTVEKTLSTPYSPRKFKTK